ncbi:MAG TPA: Bor family protein [Gemmatimonadales bacterium]|jgi:ribonuclease PH|nr:Bor family protein [Gemmatimonadales bacterium]
MRTIAAIACAALLVSTAGCFHATVETGLAPSSSEIEKGFASAWIYGLVPPSTVETQAKCGAKGVSKVETQLSFVNMLVAFITLDIYTPMSIKVTCAAGK